MIKLPLDPKMLRHPKKNHDRHLSSRVGPVRTPAHGQDQESMLRELQSLVHSCADGMASQGS